MAERLRGTRVVERRRKDDGTSEEIVHRTVGVPDVDWAALRCGGGIVFPYSTTNPVTCPDCIANRIAPGYERLRVG